MNGASSACGSGVISCRPMAVIGAGLELADGHLADHLPFVPLRSSGVDLQLHLPARRFGEVLRHGEHLLVPGGTLRGQGPELDPHRSLRGGGGGGERQCERESIHAGGSLSR